MPTEVTDWVGIIALVTSITALVDSRKANRRGPAIEALKQTIDASEKTQTYLQGRVEGKDRNRDTENQLAESWSRASFLIAHVSKDLSVRLDAKSKFWRNPDTWETDLRAHKDISLESVINDAKKLMDSYA